MEIVWLVYSSQILFLSNRETLQKLEREENVNNVDGDCVLVKVELGMLLG